MTIFQQKTMAIIASALMMLAIIAPAAIAQSSSQDGYIQEGPSVLDEADDGSTAPGDDSGNDAAVGGSGSGPAAETQEAGASQLPFTGADVGLVGAAGASLLLLGFGMRRLTSTQEAA